MELEILKTPFKDVKLQTDPELITEFKTHELEYM
jgi:hypothetical protein